MKRKEIKYKNIIMNMRLEKEGKEIPHRLPLRAATQTGLEEGTYWMRGARGGRGAQGVLVWLMWASQLILWGPSISTFRDMLCSSCCLLPPLMSAVSLCVSICFQWGRWEEGEVDGVRGREREKGRIEGRMEGREEGEYMCCRRILQFLKWVEPQYCWHVLAATG